jgi:hypothetical protein
MIWAPPMVFRGSAVTGGLTMTEATLVFGSIEQIFLLLFVLMVLVGIAGGNPSMVLKPVFDIVGQIVMTLLSLLSTLLISLIRLLGTLLAEGIKLSAETLRNGSVTQNKR